MLGLFYDRRVELFVVVEVPCPLSLYIDVPMPVELCDIPSDAKGNKFTLKWVEPHNNGAVIIDYMVYRRTVNENGEASEWEFVAPVAASTCVLTEYVITLERGKTFDLIVTARNKCGESSMEENNAKRVQVSEGRFARVSNNNTRSYLLF